MPDAPRLPPVRLSRRGFGLLAGAGVLAAGIPPVLAATTSTRRARSPFTGLVPNFRSLAPGSTQLLLVATDSYGATQAQVSGWQLSPVPGQPAAQWQQVVGAFDTAWIGGNGFAAPGTKREGDLHSPTGVFPFVTAFGVARPTGLRLPWMPVHYPFDYWIDDVRDPRYNTHVDIRVSGKKAVGRTNPLPKYPYAAVIGYNTARRVRGAGSAIFLHPTHDSPTLGCVALPLDSLAQILLWLDPAQQPRIVMGVGSTLLQLARGPLLLPLAGQPTPVATAPATPPTEPSPASPTLAPAPPSSTPSSAPSSGPVLPTPSSSASASSSGSPAPTSSGPVLPLLHG